MFARMREMSREFFFGACLLLAALDAGAACTAAHAEVASRSEDLQRFVVAGFASGNFDCAIRAMELQSGVRSRAAGTEGADARFALRNLALQVNRDTAYPAEMRLALIRAAVVEPAAPDAGGERRFNAMMLLKAGEQYVEERNTGAWLDALTGAVRLDLRQPDELRVTQPWTGQLEPDGTQTQHYLGKLLVLAEITAGDSGMASLRTALARAVRFNASAWRQGASAEVISERAAQLLGLAEALKDVRQCFGCVPEWHWRPVMLAGTAYYRIGMRAEGERIIRRAMEMARAIEKPDYRLGEYRSVLVELLTAKYDREALLGFAGEMKTLADSLDTPIAKEVRESLPRILKTWGLDRPG